MQAITNDPLITQIRNAFSTLSRPAESILYANVGGDSGRKLVADYYREKHWTHIRFEDIEDHYLDPLQLNWLVFRYFLPSFLVNTYIVAKEDPDAAFTLLDIVSEKMTPNADSEVHFSNYEYVNPFNSLQCAAILAWIEEINLIYRPFAKDWIPIRIQNYWRELSSSFESTS